MKEYLKELVLSMALLILGGILTFVIPFLYLDYILEKGGTINHGIMFLIGAMIPVGYHLIMYSTKTEN